MKKKFLLTMIVAAFFFVAVVLVLMRFEFFLSPEPARPSEAERRRGEDQASLDQTLSARPLDIARGILREQTHVTLPDEVRGIYWTAATAGNSRGDELLAYMKQTGLNTVVIDLKMDDGELAFTPHDSSLSRYAQEHPTIEDLDGLLKKLADATIYRIARIAVMRDGAFAKVHPDVALRSTSGDYWRDNIGSVWVDPASEIVSAYAIAIGREAYARGFDEVQFDYVRFVSDGSVSSIVYPITQPTQSKVGVMQKLFQTVGGFMQQNHIPVSFDVFGMTFWSRDDYNIGQRLVDALPYSDFISPMIYPSHYPNGFEGFANPAEAPYEIVKQSLDRGTSQILPIWSVDESSLRKKWRPWLQDFDIGAIYTADLIEAQIKAARDAGASGWILWNARNVYERAEYGKKL